MKGFLVSSLIGNIIGGLISYFVLGISLGTVLISSVVIMSLLVIYFYFDEIFSDWRK